MAFILHTTRSISRSGVRILSVRQLAVLITAAVLIVVAAAFGAGVLVGQRTVEPVALVAAVQPDVARERFTFDRLGDMAGRLVKLETDARSLVSKLSALESVQTRLASLDDSKTAVLPNSTRGMAAGGKVMAPKGCSPEDVKGGAAKGLDGTEKAITCLQVLLDNVEAAAAKQSVVYMAVPIEQPVNSTRIGSGYGNRVDPINGRFSFHSGIDFDAPTGTPIRSAGGGRVKTAAWVSELGFVVEIDHGNGLMSRYAHTSKMHVKAGDVVTPGQLIAEVGSTGRSTGPHLHFEILHNGKFVDPSPYLSIGAQVPHV